jgi:hypothetical protein
VEGVMGEYTTINPASKEKRREHDLYPTPEGLAKAVIDNLWYRDANPKSILDPGCGEGVWGKVAKERWPKAEVTGVEVRKVLNSESYDNLYIGEDFLAENTLYPRDWQLQKYDLIIGNPPYFAAEDFIRTSFKYLSNDGYIVFLLRQAFLASMKRYNGLWAIHFPEYVMTCSRRPSFYHADTGSKSTDGEEYAVFIWHKTWKENWYKGSLLNWEY